MKQIQTFFLIMIMCMQCITMNLNCMQPLQQELQNLNVSLQTLENKLQGSSGTPTPPPPAPIFQKQTGPKFHKAKHYEYTTPNGKKLDVSFGIVNVSSDTNFPAYSFIMYGPQLQQKPNERNYSTILLSIRQDPGTGKDIITYYPDIANENTKAEYLIIDGNDEFNKSLQERIVKDKLDILENEYKKLQDKFNANYQIQRVAGPDNEQKGSIFGTSFVADKKYVEELINFFNTIEANEKDFYEIKNLSFLDNTLIPTLNNYFNLIKNFKERVDYFTKFFTAQPTLGKKSTQNKFGIQQFNNRNEKDKKAAKYTNKIQKPIEDIFASFDNILNVTLKAQHEQLKKQPTSEVRKYYNNLLAVPSQTTITPQRDIIDALQQTGAGTSQTQSTNTKTEKRKTGIEIWLEQERLRREAKAKQKKAKKKSDEWDDDEQP